MSDSGASAPAASNPVHGSNSSGTKVLISLAAAVIVLTGLGRISAIVCPVFPALILTSCVYPLKQRLIGRGVPAALATITTVLSVFAMLGAPIASLRVSAIQLTRMLPQYTPNHGTAR